MLVDLNLIKCFSSQDMNTTLCIQSMLFTRVLHSRRQQGMIPHCWADTLSPSLTTSEQKQPQAPPRVPGAAPWGSTLLQKEQATTTLLAVWDTTSCPVSPCSRPPACRYFCSGRTPGEALVLEWLHCEGEDPTHTALGYGQPSVQASRLSHLCCRYFCIRPRAYSVYQQ